MGKLFLIFLFFVLSCCCLEKGAIAFGNQQKAPRRVHVRWFNGEETDSAPGGLPMGAAPSEASAGEAANVEGGAANEQESAGEPQGEAQVESSAGTNEPSVSDPDMFDLSGKGPTEEQPGQQQQPPVPPGPQPDLQLINQSLEKKLAEEVGKEQASSSTTTTTNGEKQQTPAGQAPQVFPEPVSGGEKASEVVVAQEPTKPEPAPEPQAAPVENGAQEPDEAVEVTAVEEEEKVPEKAAESTQSEKQPEATPEVAQTSMEPENKLHEVAVASEPPSAPPATQSASSAAATTTTTSTTTITTKTTSTTANNAEVKLAVAEAAAEAGANNNKVPEGLALAQTASGAKLESNSVPAAVVVAEAEVKEAPAAAQRPEQSEPVDLLASTVLLERLPNSTAAEAGRPQEEGEEEPGLRFELDQESCSSWLNVSLPQQILEMSVGRILKRLGPRCQERVELRLGSATNRRIRGQVMEASSGRLELGRLLGSRPIRARCHEWLRSADETSQVASFVLKLLVEPQEVELRTRWRHYTHLESLHDFPVEFPSERKGSRQSNGRRSSKGAGLKCRRFKVAGGHFRLELLELQQELTVQVELVKLSETAYGASERLGGRVRLLDSRPLRLRLGHALELAGAGRQGAPAATVQILHDHNGHQRRNDWLLDLYANWLGHEYRRQVAHLLGSGGSLQRALGSQCLRDS